MKDDHHAVGRQSTANRRCLLRLLASTPAMFGLLLVERGPSTEAKKGKKNKGKKRKKNRDKKGGGGGAYSPDSEERAFLDLINNYRRDHDAGKLALNDALGAAAEHHSADMAKKDYFKHNLSNGDSAEENIRRFGYTNYSHVGENIAAGFASANDAFDAWKTSAGHDRNMRSRNFTEIGIGRAQDKSSKYGWYWTTTFGSR